jgi:hypothetical protein
MDARYGGIITYAFAQQYTKTKTAGCDSQWPQRPSATIIIYTATRILGGLWRRRGGALNIVLCETYAFSHSIEIFAVTFA